MTAKELLAALLGLDGVEFSDAIDSTGLDRLSTIVPIPEAHRAILRVSNGLSVYGGYYRLFGVAPRTGTDMLAWNAPERWRFAWPQDLDDFWFFGETAWGDQYAYRRSELASGQPPTVYLLDALAMESEVLAADFGTFLKDDFLRSATRPTDSHLVAVRERLGDLTHCEHIVHAPSPLILGEEVLETVHKMNARAARIAAGDIYAQMVEVDFGRAVKEIRVIEDAEGRLRLKLVWSETTH